MINEESCKETEGSIPTSSGLKKSINDLIEEKTITVTVCLNVTFELKPNSKRE
jgi:hypothetical protein